MPWAMCSVQGETSVDAMSDKVIRDDAASRAALTEQRFPRSGSDTDGFSWGTIIAGIAIIVGAITLVIVLAR